VAVQPHPPSVHEGVFLQLSLPQGGGGGTLGTPPTIAQRGLLGTTGRSGGNVLWYGLVPSAVHTVTLTYAGGRQGHQRLPPIVVSGDVVNNLFIVPVPDLGPVRSWPTTMVWRNASGQIIKTINERPFHP
jgi:hypothetical protein